MKKKKKMRYKKIAAAACVPLLAILVWMFPYPKKQADEATVVSPFEAVLNKASATPVRSRFSPILIYRVVGGGRFVFAGSGSVFMGRQGEQIITSEHLFGKASGEQRYVGKPLRLKGNSVFGIEKILYTGKDLTGDMADIILLKTGVSKPIVGFSIHALGQGPLGSIRVLRNLAASSLISLVSGEKSRIVAITSDPLGTKIIYLLIDYRSSEGESGTGFIDNEDNIYVLKGTVVGSTGENFSGLGNFKALSIVYGPLTIQ